ncbi:MAG: ribbon-helix-helix protein, CopG family [Thermoproteales archaeon]|nr:ribbon-helix-helix protein, CopG family [Thermoproteales archaeon]RLE64464.1 MAG: CopG family transcriptional regulator [Thermoprotei archaeon]
MGTQVVPVRLGKNVLENIDLLVKIGIFSSRSEALRELVKLGLENLKEYVEIASAVEELFKLEESKGDIPLKLNGALKQLLEERSRF